MQIQPTAVEDKDTLAYLVGSTVYTTNDYSYGSHKIVAIYAGQTNSGGVRLVNEKGERLNPAIGPIFTDVKDIGEKMIPVLQKEIASLDSAINSAIERKNELLVTIATLNAQAQSEVPA